MRRTVIAALMTALALLAACGRGSRGEDFEKLRTAVTAASQISATAEVTGLLGDSVTAYTLSMTVGTEGADVTVLAPELIAGVRAHTDADGSSLTYEGVALDMGDFSAQGLSPVTALPRLADAIARGHVDKTWSDGGDTAVRLSPDDETTVTLWLDAETGAPVRAEFVRSEDGLVLVRCEISEFTVR